MTEYAVAHPLYFIIQSIIVLIIIGFFIMRGLNKLLKGDNNLFISKNGLIVEAKSKKKSISPKEFVNYLKETIIYIENAKEQYVDDVIGIKNRFFKQSKNFAKSRIEAVKNSIIEEYKIQFMLNYSSNPKISTDPNNLNPTKKQLKTAETSKQESPCDSICSLRCNSGLSFFDSRLQKDFKPVLEAVYSIIEENHLVNREDREYEEEIMVKAEQLSTYLKNVVISYPVPIDNDIAIKIMDKKVHDLKEAIADSLRRSRTLSKTKRDYINAEKIKYIDMRDKQLSHIINFLGEEDLSLLLKDSSPLTKVEER